MNIFTISLCFLSVSYTTAWEIGDFEKYGPLRMALDKITCDHDKTLDLDVSRTYVYFYDFRRGIVKYFPIKKSAKGILSLPNLNKNKKFFIFVGGFKSYIKGDTETHVRQAFRKLFNSYLIIIDHSPYTNSSADLITSFQRAVKHVYYIGKQLGQTLVELHQGRIPARNMHCIGHSLGAHMLGHTGTSFIKATGHKIWRITALDPAGPCYRNQLLEESVRAGVAKHVDIYHCNKHIFGTTNVLGDVDFFVNNGKSQPDCGTPLIPDILYSMKAAQCSHSQCVFTYLATLTRPNLYPAYKCDKFKHFKSNQCSNNERTIAGLWYPGNATGVYYFATGDYALDWIV